MDYDKCNNSIFLHWYYNYNMKQIWKQWKKMFKFQWKLEYAISDSSICTAVSDFRVQIKRNAVNLSLNVDCDYNPEFFQKRKKHSLLNNLGTYI